MKKLFSDIFCEVAGCKDCGQFSTCSYLKFAIISMIFGLLCILIDFTIFKLSETSYLKIKYVKGVWLVILFWTLGSFLVGYVGAATQIFDTTKILSALFVGVSWQIIFSRWAAGKFENDDTQPLNTN